MNETTVFLKGSFFMPMLKSYMKSGLMSAVKGCFWVAGSCSIKISTPSCSNMILTLGDNLGYGDIGVYGQWRIKTSNIGQPVQEGTMFKSFYPGAAVCTPSRLPLMTAYPDIVLAKAAVMETGIFRNAGFPVEGRLEKANSTV